VERVLWEDQHYWFGLKRAKPKLVKELVSEKEGKKGGGSLGLDLNTVLERRGPLKKMTREMEGGGTYMMAVFRCRVRNHKKIVFGTVKYEEVKNAKSKQELATFLKNKVAMGLSHPPVTHAGDGTQRRALIRQASSKEKTETEKVMNIEKMQSRSPGFAKRIHDKGDSQNARRL